MSLNTPAVPTYPERAAAPGRDRADATGCRIFSDGKLGAAHVLSHRLADAGRPELGYLLLGRRLRQLKGHGSEWLHLQFHLGVFEVETGRWPLALNRLWFEILPEAVSTHTALTDAPGLCWRIAMAAPQEPGLPWEPIRKLALEHLGREDSPFETAHHLLALAGAGDRRNLEAWSRRRQVPGTSLQKQALRQLAAALLAYARHDYLLAADRLSADTENLQALGGSQAQNGLFAQLEAYCRNLSNRTVPPLAAAA